MEINPLFHHYFFKFCFPGIHHDKYFYASIRFEDFLAILYSFFLLLLLLCFTFAQKEQKKYICFCGTYSKIHKVFIFLSMELNEGQFFAGQLVIFIGKM